MASAGDGWRPLARAVAVSHIGRKLDSIGCARPAFRIERQPALTRLASGIAMTNVDQAEEAIFSAARQIADRNARAAYLAQTCAGDESLRARVAALLKVHDEQLS